MVQIIFLRSNIQTEMAVDGSSVHGERERNAVLEGFIEAATIVRIVVRSAPVFSSGISVDCLVTMFPGNPSPSDCSVDVSGSS